MSEKNIDCPVRRGMPSSSAFTDMLKASRRRQTVLSVGTDPSAILEMITLITCERKTLQWGHEKRNIVYPHLYFLKTCLSWCVYLKHSSAKFRNIRVFDARCSLSISTWGNIVRTGVQYRHMSLIRIKQTTFHETKTTAKIVSNIEKTK